MKKDKKLYKAINFFLNKYNLILHFKDDSYTNYKKKISHKDDDTFKTWKEKTFSNGNADIEIFGKYEITNNTKFSTIKREYNAVHIKNIIKLLNTELVDTINSKKEKEVDKKPELKEHMSISHGDIGYSYESIICPFLEGAEELTIEDPYIRSDHQIHNFVRFCEAVIKAPALKKINLITSYDKFTSHEEIKDKLGVLKQSLFELDVELNIDLNTNMHDREIRVDTGWIIKIGRGLDFYQKPDSWYEIGSNDLSQRKCLETKIDIFKQK